MRKPERRDAPRTERMTLSLTPAEAQAIRAASELLGMTQAEFTRRALLAYVETQNIEAGEIERFKRLLEG